MGGLSVSEFRLLNISDLRSTNSSELMLPHHHTLLLQPLGLHPFCNYLLIYTSLGFDCDGVGLVLLSFELGWYGGVLPLGPDSAGVESDALMTLSHKTLSLLSNQSAYLAQLFLLNETFLPDLEHLLVLVLGQLLHLLFPAQVDLEVADSVAQRRRVWSLGAGFLAELVDA